MFLIIIVIISPTTFCFAVTKICCPSTTATREPIIRIPGCVLGPGHDEQPDIYLNHVPPVQTRSEESRNYTRKTNILFYSF